MSTALAAADPAVSVPKSTGTTDAEQNAAKTNTNATASADANASANAGGSKPNADADSAAAASDSKASATGGAPEVHLRVHAAGITHPGVEHRQNQDAFFIWRDPVNGHLVAGVLDGHGRELGQTAAYAARDSFENAMPAFSANNFAAFRADPKAEFQKLFNAAHEAIRQVRMDCFALRRIRKTATRNIYVCVYPLCLAVACFLFRGPYTCFDSCAWFSCLLCTSVHTVVIGTAVF